MNNSKTNSTNSKLIQSIFVFMLFLMFSFSGFSQSQTIEFTEKAASINVKVESSRATSNMEFALWFMGTKQDPNSTLSAEGNAKKSIITSGIAPNRLLLKAFLKKVVNYENSLS